MAGRRRLAVGFLQIVPGVFPTGVVTDRLLTRRQVVISLDDISNFLRYVSKIITRKNGNTIKYVRVRYSVTSR
jgi:hypothetical protein